MKHKSRFLVNTMVPLKILMKSSITFDSVNIIVAAVNAKILIANIILSNGLLQLIVRQLAQIHPQVASECGAKLHNFGRMKAPFGNGCVGGEVDESVGKFHLEMVLSRFAE